MADNLLRAEYESVKRACAADWQGKVAHAAILELVTVSLHFLAGKCKAIDLVSRVSGKEYFTFAKGKTIARPANKAFFLSDPALIKVLWRRWTTDRSRPRTSAS
jgi:hypothetical protein